MNMRTTVRLPEDLLRRAKQKAAKDQTTLTALIENGLRNILTDDRGKTGPVRLPRVSAAKGKVLVDLSSNVKIFDAMDEGVPLEKLR